MSDVEDPEEEKPTQTSDAETEESGEPEESAVPGGETTDDERDAEDADSPTDPEPAPPAIPLAEPAPAAPPEIHAVPDPDQERQDRVRQKLREMYGDDSAETVRRFLYELTSDEEDEPSN